ncbi:MAG: hypothetical protein CMH83_20025 [Nocardioides sp.]|nr:hypothetical protein [Nocardioides sp.]
MTARRTFTERRVYSARVMKFRAGVYAGRGKLTPGCQLLLLRLADDMNANAIVSVPRSHLADDLAAPAPRITEWISEAIEKRFLDRVRRGQPGVTAVYQGLIRNPVEVRRGVPSQRYAQPDQAEVRPGVPTEGVQRYATGGSHEEAPAGTFARTGSGELSSPSRRGSNEETEGTQADGRLTDRWWLQEPPEDREASA